MTSSHMPRNRLSRMRMRDGERWALVYRERAWEVAVEEARTRSFLHSLYFAVGMMARQWSPAARLNPKPLRPKP